MIHINANIPPNTCIQLWSPDNPTCYVLFDECTNEFQHKPLRRTEECVFMRISVNNIVRGYLLMPYPNVDKEGRTVLWPTALCVRLWSSGSIKLMVHSDISWMEILHEKMRYGDIRLQTTYVGGVGCSSPSPSPSPPAPLSCSPNAIFEYTGVPVATENWMARQLDQAKRLVGRNNITRDVILDMLSFMFLKTTSNSLKNNAPLPIDSILRDQRTDVDLVGVAYHLIMTLLFTKWSKGSEVAMFRDMVVKEYGFPYVVSKNWSYYGIIMVPYSKIDKTENLPPKLDHFGTMLTNSDEDATSQHLPFYHRSSNMEYKESVPYKNRKICEDYTRRDGNAHILLVSDSKIGSAVIALDCKSMEVVDGARGEVEDITELREGCGEIPLNLPDGFVGEIENSWLDGKQMLVVRRLKVEQHKFWF